MKRKPMEVFLISILLLVLIGSGQTQIISPQGSTELPMGILIGLVGNYMFMLQQYQNLIEQGGAPSSVFEFRLAAEIATNDVDTDSELDSILTGLSKMAFWIKGNILSKYPLVKINISGSLGDIQILNTEDESIFVSLDESVFSVLSPSIGISDIAGMIAGEDISATDLDLSALLGLLEDQVNGSLLENLADISMEYDGFEATPKGMAHVVRLSFADTGDIVTLWVLDETWDLYKLAIESPTDGSSAIILIENIEFITAAIPDAEFEIDTTGLSELSYEDFLVILGLKVFSSVLTGVPVAADLSFSLPEVRQGEQVVIRSNGMDAEDDESELVAQIEYRTPNGSWTQLEAGYVGVPPLGRWEAAFVPSLDAVLGSYDFRVTYTDTGGNTSDALEMPGALNVVAMPPQVVSVSPADNGKDISLDTDIVVVFSQKMDKTSLDSAFSLVDSSGHIISGTFDLAGDPLVFRPDQELMYGQVYTARVLGIAMALNTATLDTNMDGTGAGSPVDDYVWSFTTKYAPLPVVSKIGPDSGQRHVLISAKVSASFTESMDQTTTESAFSLVSTDGEVVSGSFQWSGNTLTFTPSQNLDYNTTYRVKIAGFALSAVGAGLDSDDDGIAEGSPKDDFSWWFRSEEYPVFAVKPASKTGLGGDLIEVDIAVQTVLELTSFTLTIDFEPAVLDLLKVERTAFAVWRPRPRIVEDADMWRPTVIDDEHGFITLAADKTRSGGISGTGVIATLTFRAVGVGESPIVFREVSAIDAKGNDIAPELSNGQVQVLEFAAWDVNKDGIINILDFVAIQKDRGADADVNDDGIVDTLDMVAAAGNMQGSPAWPTSNALGNNFPNPFNPETWVPYELVGDASVTIRIYNAVGRLVRSLDLGYKLAGKYVTKASAAYWDGNNESGEPVASGIYYYSIEAGDFSAVKKMVVSD